MAMMTHDMIYHCISVYPFLIPKFSTFTRSENEQKSLAAEFGLLCQ